MGFVDFLLGALGDFLFGTIADFLLESRRVLVAIAICAGFGTILLLTYGKTISGAILGVVASVSGMYVIYGGEREDTRF